MRRTVTVERSMISICMAKLPSNRCENTWHVYEEENEEHACRHVLQTCSRSQMLQVLLEIHLDDGASESEADGCARIDWTSVDVRSIELMQKQ